MKKFLYIGFAVLVACNSSSEIDPRVLTVPSFQMQLIDSRASFNTADIKKGEPTIVVYFSPTCKFSHQQTMDFVNNHEALKNVKIYMCSNAPLQKLHDFSEHYHLNRYNNITVGRDVNGFFDRQLKVTGYPWSFIYASDKQLKKIATGYVETKRILELYKG